MVAAGFWKKLKRGVKWINDKIIKPVAKPVLNVAKKFIPFGDAVSDVVEAVSDVVEAVSDGIDGNWGTARNVAREQYNQRIAPRLRPT